MIKTLSTIERNLGMVLIRTGIVIIMIEVVITEFLIFVSAAVLEAPFLDHLHHLRKIQWAFRFHATHVWHSMALALRQKCSYIVKFIAVIHELSIDLAGLHQLFFGVEPFPCKLIKKRWTTWQQSWQISWKLGKRVTREKGAWHAIKIVLHTKKRKWPTQRRQFFPPYLD